MVGFPMHNECSFRFIKLPIICILAIGANLLVMVFRHLQQHPLFIDTVFTVAVTFALGLVPGIAVAVLTWIADGIIGSAWQPFHPFVLVAIAEVFLVYALRPADLPLSQVSVFKEQNPAIRDRRLVAIFGVFMRLAMIYIVCAIVASVLGGVIDFLYHTVWGAQRPYYIGLNAFRMALSQDGVPVILAEILSRFQVNVIDRLIVVSGGYIVSRMIIRLVKRCGGVTERLRARNPETP